MGSQRDCLYTYCFPLFIIATSFCPHQDDGHHCKLAGRHLSICVGECDLTNNYFHEKQIHLKYISRTTSRKCRVSLKINKPCSSTESECGMKRRKVTQCDQSPLPGRCESMRVDEGRAGSARKTLSGACLRALSAVVTHAFSSLCAAKRAVSSEVSKTSSLNA